MANRNAAPTQSGFHYQDIVGLIILLDNIEDIQEINVEGQDDIDVLFTDGKLGYYQVKEVENPNNQRMSEKLTEALATLEEDAVNKNVRLLTYVSNANQPLGNLKNSLEFNRPYAYYLYRDLPAQLQSKIDNKLSTNSKIDKNQLGIMKIAYEGSDVLTKESELDQRINIFIGKSRIPNFHTINLKNEWCQMISRNTESPSQKITKKDFYAHTVVTEMFQTPDFDTFFDEFQILESNVQYIQNNYTEHLERLMKRFELLNGIETSFQEYRQAHPEFNRKNLKFYFINEYYLEFKDNLGLTHDEDDDVVKFLIWVSIKTTAMTKQIKDVINL